MLTQFHIDAMFRVVVPKAAGFLPPTHRLGEYRTSTRRKARRILQRSRYYQNLSLREKVKLMRRMMDIPRPGS